MINLPNVTLACIDTRDHAKALSALNECMRHINFGAVKFFTDTELDIKGIQTVKIRQIHNKEQYSFFVMRLLTHHIDTEFVMLCQWDGFILNPEAWRDDFLLYDYVGAPWWYDERNVGNGGFSLRSKKLMNLFLTQEFNGKFHPEDEAICRDHREKLEAHGIRFAPEWLASIFSYEHNPKHPKYNGAFGFHGTQIKQFLPTLQI